MTAPKLLEKDIQRACEDILLLDGWEIIRREKQWSEKKKKATGELGAADCMAVRYDNAGMHRYCIRVWAEVLHIEWKRPKTGKLRTSQRIWHDAKRKQGAVTWIAGEQFEPTYESFKAHYEASGLCRRRLT
jgi:spermidine synthase